MDRTTLRFPHVLLENVAAKLRLLLRTFGSLTRAEIRQVLIETQRELIEAFEFYAVTLSPTIQRF